MSNLSSVTANISIKRPELWTLMLALRHDNISFILYNEQENDSLITGTLDLDLGAGSYLQAVENAVYDNPVLLDDYRRVAILVSAPHFLVLPPEVDDADQAAPLLEAAYPDDDNDVAVCRLPKCGVNIAFGLQRGLQQFLNRTFNLAPVHHHLYPLCEHFKHLNEGTSIARMFINLHRNDMDMAIFNQGRLVMANSYPLRNAADATFLTLHAWKSYQLDPLNDEIQLTGDKNWRDTLATELRRYVRYVMPAIYPAAALRLGHDATKAPLDLILLATCE